MSDRPPLRERAGQAADPALVAMRRAMQAALAAGALDTDPPAETVRMGGVRCLRFAPTGAVRGTVLHFHGGGYRLGLPEQVGGYARALADACGVAVVCPAYRLAPEHPYPAAINDGWRVWQAVAEAGNPVLLSGDSAGGGLAAGLVALAGRGGPRVDGLVLLSPWLDLSVSSACYAANAATDPLFSREAAQAAAALYLQGLSPSLPGASPLMAVHDHFPPTLIAVGDGEVLADDAIRLRGALGRAGVPVTLRLVPGMGHVAAVRGAGLPGAAETFAAACGFVADRLTAGRHRPSP